ncbi:MAG: hypothetical protein IJN70_06645 [Clostridia bacterium]|nr:hypothetical protein [Clostridia bacterium]
MEENQKGFIAWVKAHKKQLIVAGISITAIIGVILGIKNKETLDELWKTLKDSLKKTTPTIQTDLQPLEDVIPFRQYTLPQEPVDVVQHIRTLSEGRHHSAKKAAEAAALGITLLPNQTLVDKYTKYYNAA